MQYYVTERLSENIGKTPEGFLLCRSVPAARTGYQLYTPGEVPDDIEPDGDGTILVERNPEEVFAPEMLASLVGKPLTNEHPTEAGDERIDVTPENWRQFAVGVVLNPRQGEGIADDLLYVDLLVTDPETIDDIMEGRKRELSVGYEAMYKVKGRGRAEQTQIRANHIAVIPSGRCGPRCQIRDERSVTSQIYIPQKRRHVHIHI